MKFLVDADLPNSAVEPFQETGYEAEHVRKAGLGTAPDSEVAEYANRGDYILVTRDQAFGSPLPPRVEEGRVVLKLHNYKPGELKGRPDYFYRIST